MILLKNLSKDEIHEIAVHVTEAFMAEEGGFPQSFSFEECLSFLEAEINVIYKTGALYTFSENREGYAAYWLKKDRPPIWRHFQMAYDILKKMPMKRYMVFARSMKGWQGYETIYKNEDYVDFFMVAIRPQYQGKGLLRIALQEAFEYAGKHHVRCVLDTDSQLKADKYMHCGMTLIKDEVLASGLHMFTLEKDMRETAD